MLSPDGFAPPNKLPPAVGGGPAGVVEKLSEAALLAAGVVVPPLPNRPPEAGCAVAFIPPKKDTVVAVGVCAGVVELSPGLLKLKPGVLAVFPNPPPLADSLFWPKLNPVLPPELLLLPPKRDGLDSPEEDALPNREGLDVPGAFPVLCPKSDGLDASAEPNNEPEDAPLADAPPKLNFGGSGILSRSQCDKIIQGADFARCPMVCPATSVERR